MTYNKPERQFSSAPPLPPDDGEPLLTGAIEEAIPPDSQEQIELAISILSGTEEQEP